MCKKSDSIIEIAKALCGFNSEISKIAKDSTNPHFKNKYASLDNIIDEIRPILTKHGLSIIQMPGGDGENFKMSTLLIHESGEWIESDPIVMKPVKNDPQGIGSCATYARRYSLSAFLSLNTGEDDDGNGASKQPLNPANNTGQPNTPPPSQNGNTGQSGSTSNHPSMRIFALQKELGWKTADLNEFISTVLQKDVKYPLKDYIKTPEEWALVEEKMLVTKEAS